MQVEKLGQSAAVAEMLTQLLPEDLSGVTFVRDYLQLQFNPPPTINVYSKCRVVSAEASSTFGEPAFANLLLEQIGQSVVKVFEVQEVVVIELGNGSRLEMPYGPGTFVGPEAIVFLGRGNYCGAWP